MMATHHQIMENSKNVRISYIYIYIHPRPPTPANAWAMQQEDYLHRQSRVNYTTAVASIMAEEECVITNREGFAFVVHIHKRKYHKCACELCVKRTSKGLAGWLARGKNICPPPPSANQSAIHDGRRMCVCFFLPSANRRDEGYFIAVLEGRVSLRV